MTPPRRLQNTTMPDEHTAAIILTNPQHQIASWNAGAAHLYGWAAKEVCGQHLYAVLPIERWVDSSQEQMQAALRTHGYWRGHLLQRYRDGRPVLVEATICLVPILPPGWLLCITRPLREPVGIVVVEMTTRKRREVQLLHTQKVNTHDQMTNVIAHDFNNLLTAMAGYAMLARAALPPESSAHADLDELQRSTQRAAELTSQLLAITRQQSEPPVEIDLHQRILSIARLLRRLLGKVRELLDARVRPE